MKRIVLFFSIVFFYLTSFAYDILTLTNGYKFEGEVVEINNCDVHFLATDGFVYIIPSIDIFSLCFENPSSKIYVDYLNNISNDDPDKCMKGRMDADNYHGKEGIHVALGILFGPLAIIGAAVSNPTPQKGKDTYAMSQNKDLFQDPVYLNCYTKKARNKNVTNAAIGWGTWILILLLL
jgi:hypothetical protein